MSHALYRKYRSRGFDEVVGQRHVTDLLRSAVKNGAISHAYLFTGPRGTGKTSVARILAHEVNGLPYIDDATHLDIIEIDAASNRRIDDIRDLREKVYIAPTSARYKVYIIDEVHMLTGESFNALLKTLEEPPAHAIFILATTELHKVPATIVSRTQRFHFRPGSLSDVAAHLRMIADKEKIDISDDALRLIAEHSEGGFRDSVSLLDQVSSLDQSTIGVDMIERLLGLAPHAAINAIVDCIAEERYTDATQGIHRLLDNGTSPHVIIAQLIKHLAERAATSPHLYHILYELVEVPKSYAPQLKLLAVVGRGQESAEQPVRKDVVSKRDEDNTPKTRPREKTPAAPETKPLPARDDPLVNSKDETRAPEHKDDDATGSTIVWDDVLAQLRSHAPALHSVLKRASVTIDDTGVHLGFAFALHRKKMSDEKARQELVRTITALYGSCPPICVDDTTTHLDETSKAVADIMGGGEPVQVPADGRT